LTNRVYRLEAEAGTFFLRLPEQGNAQAIDRVAEAHNLALAAKTGLALPPVYCDPACGVLVTRAVAVSDEPPEDGPKQLGAALGQLHASGANFRGLIEPDGLRVAQVKRIGSASFAGTEINRLTACLDDLARSQRQSTTRLVPSHGDPSPGNCLFASDRLWLIDWEYSAMADPAWDLAYAILEHGYAPQEEQDFLSAYRAVADDDNCVSSRRIEIMKSRCDAVSALWALEQVAAGREEAVFLPFARARRDRALVRLGELPGQAT
jgi:aminoglycoside phosphotransferase (APT) family kinase protein